MLGVLAQSVCSRLVILLLKAVPFFYIIGNLEVGNGNVAWWFRDMTGVFSHPEQVGEVGEDTAAVSVWASGKGVQNPAGIV